MTSLNNKLVLDRQVCVIKAVAYKSLKTEGPKILSNDIFYFRAVIFGGPISINCLNRNENAVDTFFSAGQIKNNSAIIIIEKMVISKSICGKRFGQLIF